jgi:DNA polymerase III subunit delta
MTPKELARQLQQGVFKPLNLLHGEEPYVLDEAEALFDRHVLQEAERPFNLTLLYGRDTDAQTVMDAASRYPVFAERQLIIVREAQSMRDLEKLLPYAERPVPSTVLVLVHKYKKLPANRKLFKAIQAHGLVFEAKGIRENQVPAWIADYLKERGHRIQPDAAQLIAEYQGADLSRISGELDKLLINLQPGASVSCAEVEKYIGISREYNVFEWQNALMRADIEKVWKIGDNLRANMRQNPLVMIISNLYNLLSKLYLAHFLQGANDRDLAQALGVNPYFAGDYRKALAHWSVPRLERALAVLLQYDLRAKGVDDAGTEPEELFRELTWKLLR